MPQNKNQHYVPQSYFRLFSKNGTHIESYNLKHQKGFTSSIRHMCAKDYFYSKETEIESVLSNLESSQNSIMNSIVATHKIPNDPKEYLILLSFISLQHARTEVSKIRGDESMGLVSDEIVKGLLGSSDEAEIRFPKIHLMKMQHALQTIPLLGDLIPVVLINNTQNSFIFSDNPIAFHNTAFNKQKDFGILGLQSPGLQIFCPISDKILLMFYDPKFYSVNIGKNYSLEINDMDNIENLNTLQFLNCNENIFYSDKSKESGVNALHKKVKHLVGKRKMKKKIIQLPEDKEGKTREFLHMYEERPKYDLKLSFVKLNQVSNFGMVRNQVMFDKIYKDMDQYQKAQSSKFYRFFYDIKRTFRYLKFCISERFRKI